MADPLAGSDHAHGKDGPFLGQVNDAHTLRYGSHRAATAVVDATLPATGGDRLPAGESGESTTATTAATATATPTTAATKHSRLPSAVGNGTGSVGGAPGLGRPPGLLSDVLSDVGTGGAGAGPAPLVREAWAARRQTTAVVGHPTCSAEPPSTCHAAGAPSVEPEPAWHWTSDGETDLPPPTTIDAAIDPVRDGCAPQGNCTADCTLPCDAEHRGAPTFLVCDLTTGLYSGDIKLCVRLTVDSDIDRVPFCSCEVPSPAQHDLNLVDSTTVYAEHRFQCQPPEAPAESACTNVNWDGSCPSFGCFSYCRNPATYAHVHANHEADGVHASFWNFTVSGTGVAFSLPATRGPSRYLRILRGRVAAAMMLDDETQICTRLDPHQDFRIVRRAAEGLRLSVVYDFIFLFWDATDPESASPIEIGSQLSLNAALQLPPLIQNTLTIRTGVPVVNYTRNLHIQVAQDRLTDTGCRQHRSMPDLVFLASKMPGLDAACGLTPWHTDCITTGTSPYTVLSRGLPTGLSIDPMTGVMSGTPQASGNYTVIIQVRDRNLQLRTFAPFFIRVTEPLSINTNEGHEVIPLVRGGDGGASGRWNVSGVASRAVSNGSVVMVEEADLAMFVCSADLDDRTPQAPAPYSDCTAATEPPCLLFDFSSKGSAPGEFTAEFIYQGQGVASYRLVALDLILGDIADIAEVRLNLELPGVPDQPGQTEDGGKNARHDEHDEHDVMVYILTIGTALILLVALVAAILVRRARRKAFANAGAIAAAFGFPDVDEWEYARGSLKMADQLGEGAFGIVTKATAVSIRGRSGVSVVAVKECRTTAFAEDKVNFIRECTLMKQLRHPNVVELLGVCLQSEPLLLIEEYMEHGDLKKHIRGRRTVALKTLLGMARDVASGLWYLHDSHRFVHRDLASRNCLLNAKLEVKIGDFGMSRATLFKDYYRLSHEAKLPVRWMAPESLREGNFSSASDIWSLGIVIWELCSFCEVPYPAMGNTEVFAAISKGYRLPKPALCPAVVHYLCLQCWDAVPNRRPSANGVSQVLQLHFANCRRERPPQYDADDEARSLTRSRPSSATSLPSELSVSEPCNVDTRGVHPRSNSLGNGRPVGGSEPLKVGSKGALQPVVQKPVKKQKEELRSRSGSQLFDVEELTVDSGVAGIPGGGVHPPRRDTVWEPLEFNTAFGPAPSAPAPAPAPAPEAPHATTPPSAKPKSTEPQPAETKSKKPKSKKPKSTKPTETLDMMLIAPASSAPAPVPVALPGSRSGGKASSGTVPPLKLALTEDDDDGEMVIAQHPPQRLSTASMASMTSMDSQRSRYSSVTYATDNALDEPPNSPTGSFFGFEMDSLEMKTTAKSIVHENDVTHTAVDENDVTHTAVDDAQPSDLPSPTSSAPPTPFQNPDLSSWTPQGTVDSDSEGC